jgi:hypothetical protein
LHCYRLDRTQFFDANPSFGCHLPSTVSSHSPPLLASACTRACGPRVTRGYHDARHGRNCRLAHPSTPIAPLSTLPAEPSPAPRIGVPDTRRPFAAADCVLTQMRGFDALAAGDELETAQQVEPLSALARWHRLPFYSSRPRSPRRRRPCMVFGSHPCPVHTHTQLSHAC